MFDFYFVQKRFAIVIFVLVNLKYRKLYQQEHSMLVFLKICSMISCSLMRRSSTNTKYVYFLLSMFLALRNNYPRSARLCSVVSDVFSLFCFCFDNDLCFALSSILCFFQLIVLLLVFSVMFQCCVLLHIFVLSCTVSFWAFFSCLYTRCIINTCTKYH